MGSYGVSTMLTTLTGLLLICLTGGFRVENTLSPGFITLYENSEVVNIYDSNIYSLYNSDTLWLVQFYNHWCGHCQRFAPIWKALAEDILDWAPIVKIAAINCADQSCDRYQIKGTPTIRIFPPNTKTNVLDSSYYGFEVPVKNDKDYFLDIILYNLALVETKTGSVTGVNLKTMRNVPSPSQLDLQSLFVHQPEAENIALIFEQEGKDSVGKKVILDLSKERNLLPVHRINMMDVGVRDWGTLSVPTMVVINTEGEVVQRVAGWGISQDRAKFRKILQSYVDGLGGVTNVPVATAPTHTHTPYKVPDTVTVSRPDLVHQSDLEKAVQYSITKEVATQPILDQRKLQTLYQYLETLINFFPNMRPELKNFLISLREWPVMMRLKSLTNTHYKAKVEELLLFHRPFAGTPSDWADAGCAGSSPQFRGYPCSLWTLFHTLMSSATNKDLAWRYHGTMSTVANTMINYIRDFFSCRDCSENFNSHVASIGYLPRNPDQSLLWLWTIHNTANVLLSGDPTEVTFIRLMSSLHYSSGSSSSEDSLAQPGQLPGLPEKWIWKQVVTNASG